ncbi:MAG: hypothetical protein L3K18_09865 [Thermoplasmata archaeon]|nr:hypothetical protein [Thermoplasmata archaeon]MCI4357419.1 hypothetical protein [Thermoplasmata archaeon]
MQPLSNRARLRIVGWEVVAIGGLWSVLQILAALDGGSVSDIEQFLIDGGLGVLGLSMILVGMECLALVRAIHIPTLSGEVQPRTR